MTNCQKICCIDLSVQSYLLCSGLTQSELYISGFYLRSHPLIPLDFVSQGASQKQPQHQGPSPPRVSAPRSAIPQDGHPCFQGRRFPNSTHLDHFLADKAQLEADQEPLRQYQLETRGQNSQGCSRLSNIRPI
jgi:hypothetical protein